MMKKHIKQHINTIQHKAKNYSTILALQLLLVLNNGCESPINSRENNQNNKIETIDTTDIKTLAEKHENIAYEAAKTQNQTIIIPNFIKALDYYQQLGDKKQEQIISKNIALGYYQQGNYPKYLEYIQKAKEIAEKIDYEYGIRFANLSLGGYHMSIKKQPEIALQKFYLPGREKLELLSNEEDKKELQTLYAVEIASAYMDMANYKEAMKYRKQSIELNKEINNISTNILINYNMGVAEQNQRKYTDAEKLFLQGVKLSEEAGTSYNTKEGYNYLANLYEIIGDHKKAYEYRTKQHTIAQEINNETSSRTQIELETSIKDKQLIEQKAEIVQQEEKEKTLQEQKKKMIWSTITAILAALGIGGFALSKNKSNKLKKKQNEELTKRNEEITQQKKTIEKAHNSIKESIEAGKKVQEKIVLSSPEYIKKLFPESFILFKPKDGVSGDFYRFKETKSGKKLFAAVDCTGHGIPGAFMSFTGSKILNEAIDKGLEQPSEILSFLDEKIIDLQKEEGEEDVFAKYGMDIALCSRDETTKTLEYSGAVNPIYIINGSSKETITKAIKPNMSKIGYKIEGQKSEYKNDSIQITDPNTIIYLSSDGYQDQFGGPNKKKLKRMEFKKYIEQASKIYFSKENATMQDIQHNLEEKFEKRIGEQEQIDDVLVMGIEV